MKKKIKNKKLFRLKAFDYFNLVFLTIMALIAIIPIIYLINHAFKPLNELFLYPPRFFVSNPTFRNFRELLSAVQISDIPVTRYIFNSLVVVTLTVSATVILSSMAAYALSKIDFIGRKKIFGAIVISLMFSAEAVMITRYLVIGGLGLLNSYAAHILPQVAMPVGVFLIKQFMDQVPDSIIEAAKIDGASQWRVFMGIVVPNVIPAIGTAAILSFQAVWMDPTTSQLYMLDEYMKTLPHFVFSLTSGLSNAIARQGASAAASLLMFAPNFIIFVIMQRTMIDTLKSSGIKS